jgi:hypothetical protein
MQDRYENSIMVSFWFSGPHALGVSSASIYPPNSYAKTGEPIAVEAAAYDTFFFCRTSRVLRKRYDWRRFQ